MNDEEAVRRGIGRRIVHDRGNRYVLPRTVSDQAHRDAFGDPTIPFRDLDEQGNPIRFPADADAVVGDRDAPFGSDVRPDADGDDQPNDDSEHQSRNDATRDADWDGWCNAFVYGPRAAPATRNRRSPAC